MNMKSISLVVLSVSAIIFSIDSYADWWPFGKIRSELIGGEVTDLDWVDLIPENFVFPENPFSTMTQEEVDKLLDGSEESNAEFQRLQAEFAYAPVVPELDGKRVRIRAYVTPLDFNSRPDSIKEFLLVPVGAGSLNTEAPPLNQIIYSATAEPIDFPGMFKIVWAIGTIRTETIETKLAVAGYQLEVEKLWPFEYPPKFINTNGF